MDWLKIVAKEHKDYVKVVQSFGEYFYAEDIVQEAYLRITKYCKPESIIQNNQINKGFMYFVLRNIYLDYEKHKNKHPKISIEELGELQCEESDYIQKQAYEQIICLINDESQGWHWYDKMLFELYKKTGKSIRDISSETKISTKSIFQTLKNCKNKLKENVGEDYTDYKNGDYELILKQWQKKKNKQKDLEIVSSKF